MDDKNELIQVTTRLPLKDKEKIDSLAKSGGCSTAEIIRRSVEGSLNKYLDGVQYVDREQGEAIKELLGSVHTELSGMRTELHRIGVNYNQDVKRKNQENMFTAGKNDILELMNARQPDTEESTGFPPNAVNKIIKRFDAIVEEFVNVMAYTRISHTRNGRAAIQYARGNGRGHNGHAKRNLLIGCVGMLPDDLTPFEEQMAEDWARASGKNKNQVRRIVISFSEKELDPHGEDSAYLALEMAQEFVEGAYPNRKAAIFVQNDGKGGKLHIHALVSNVDSVEHKGCTDEQTKFDYVKENFNRVAGRHITLDSGKKAKEKLSQNERRIRDENEEAAEKGGAEEYSWKDDMRRRILLAMENADSEYGFLEVLEKEGIKARYGKSKSYGEYVSYELVDVPDHMKGTDRKYKARSYTLGDAYGVDALREKLDERYKAFFRPSKQRNNAAKSKDDLPGASQRGLNTEAAQAPVNGIPEMKRAPAPAVQQKSARMVAATINALINDLPQEVNAETPIPAQPAYTVPQTAAAEDGGTDSTPEGKQLVQSATAPQTGKLKYLEQLRAAQRETDEREARKQLENQDDMGWLPRR